MAMDNEPSEDQIDCKVERKRQREAQRRSEMATAYNDLESLLKLLDRGSDFTSTGNTRYDLIRQSIEVIQSLYAENKELKKRAKSRGSSDEEREMTLLTVPTFTPSPEDRKRSKSSTPRVHPHHPENVVERYYGPHAAYYPSHRYEEYMYPQNIQEGHSEAWAQYYPHPDGSHPYYHHSG